jgi:hypothetical protein
MKRLHDLVQNLFPATVNTVIPTKALIPMPLTAVGDGTAMSLSPHKNK